MKIIKETRDGKYIFILGEGEAPCVNNKIEYISEKEINKMNIDELRKLSSKLKINKKLKIDIINEIVNTFNKF